MDIKRKTCVALGCIMFFSFFAIGVPVIVAGDYTSLFKGEETGTGVLGRELFRGVQEDPRELARDIIFIILGFLGTLMIALILYSGFLWTTASGDEEKIKKAQNHLRDAIIGAVVIMSAWTISIFVLESLKYTVKEGGELDTLESELEKPTEYDLDSICNAAASSCDEGDFAACKTMCKEVCTGAKFLSDCTCHSKSTLGGTVNLSMGCKGKK